MAAAAAALFKSPSERPSLLAAALAVAVACVAKRAPTPVHKASEAASPAPGAPPAHTLLILLLIIMA